MRLQIKKIEGPSQIRLNESVDAIYAYEINSANTDADDKYTVYFNRAVLATDTFPIPVTIKVYDHEGTLEQTLALNVELININNADSNANFSFILKLDSPETLSGSFFYIHAIIINTITGAHNIDYEISSYHNTIKKIFIYAEKEIKEVYWSSSEEITYEEEEATQENVRMGNIGQNEDAFLHIKTVGLYDNQVTVVLTANDRTVELLNQTFSMRRNRRVIAFDMAEVIQRYRQQTDTLEGDVSMILVADVYASSDLDLSARILNSDQLLSSDVVLRDVSIIKSTEGIDLNVISRDANPPIKRTSTGTVYVNVNTGETPDIVSTRFTDFKIGRICHFEGVGRIENKYLVNNATVRLTVYPFWVYDIMLSDLVVAGAITIDDAIIIGPPPEQQTDEARQRKRTQLERDFNKLTTAITNNENGESRVLLDLFGETERFGSSNVYKLEKKELVRNILSVAQTREPIFEREISIDAWQGDSSRLRAGRYNYAKECAPGEYFINYKSGGKYRVMVSQYASPAYIANGLDAIACIVDYPHGVAETTPRRGSIALHKGGPQASIGCLTFNVQYTKENNNYTVFNDIMYPVKNNNRYLSFICIDQRNALQNTSPDHRYYDLIKPPGARGNNLGSTYETSNELPATEVSDGNDPEFEGSCEIPSNNSEFEGSCEVSSN